MSYMDREKFKNFQQQARHKIMVFRSLYEDVIILLQTCKWKARNRPGFLQALCNLGIHVNCHLKSQSYLAMLTI